jgi:hypothetical protein
MEKNKNGRSFFTLNPEPIKIKMQKKPQTWIALAERRRVIGYDLFYLPST